MTLHDPGVTLRQLLDHARALAEVVHGRKRADLDSDRIFQWAILRGLEVLGEAAHRLPEEFHERYPRVPWGDMIGMRNRLIHAYEEVNLDFVWRAAHDRLGAVIDYLEEIVPEWPITED